MFSAIYAITVNSPNLIPNQMFKFRSNSGRIPVKSAHRNWNRNRNKNAVPVPEPEFRSIYGKNCYDKHDPNNLYDVDDLHELSKILNNCKNYDVKGFNGFTKTINTDNNIFSCLFNNIDGNASNFAQFASEILGQLKNCFSVVALTETNTNIFHKDLYQLSNYISVYNEKYPGKRKGSGIGLYIHNQFIFN